MASWAAPKWAQLRDRGTPRITKTGKRDAGSTPGPRRQVVRVRPRIHRSAPALAAPAARLPRALVPPGDAVAEGAQLNIRYCRAVAVYRAILMNAQPHLDVLEPPPGGAPLARGPVQHRRHGRVWQRLRRVDRVYVIASQRELRAVEVLHEVAGGGEGPEALDQCRRRPLRV